MEEVGTRTVPAPDQTRIVDVESLEWQSFGDGIRGKILHQDKDTGAATILFRFEPGARAPLHEHTALEQTYVLEGEFEDHDGVVAAGNFAVREPGSVHAGFSRTGSLHIAFFSGPVRHVESGEMAAFSQPGDD